MTSGVRAGRRRRLLHEGVGAGQAPSDEPAGASSSSRYAPKEGSASYAVAAKLLPRTWYSLSFAVCALAALLAGIVALDAWAQTVRSVHLAGVLTMSHAGSLASWWTATLWLIIAGVAAIVFGLRRSRMDDLRCGYRWWAVGALTAVGMSLSAAIGGGGLVGAALAEATGFSPLPGDAFWWLLPGTLVLGGLAIRLLVDLSESPIAMIFGLSGAALVAAASLSDAGLAPGAIRSASPLLAAPVFGPAATIAGLSLTAMSLLCLSRRIVRESLGEVTSTPAAAAKKAERQAEDKQPAAAEKKPASPRRSKPAPTPTKKAAAEAEPADEPTTAWVGGADDDYRDEYDDQPQRRRLSKAERKRLRKQKARRAA